MKGGLKSLIMEKETKIVQVNMLIPEDWKVKLERQARVQAVEKDCKYSYIELIKDTIKEKFDL